MSRTTGLTLSSTQRDPLYRQIFDQVVERIDSGAFPPGYRLPPSTTWRLTAREHRSVTPS